MLQRRHLKLNQSRFCNPSSHQRHATRTKSSGGRAGRSGCDHQAHIHNTHTHTHTCIVIRVYDRRSLSVRHCTCSSKHHPASSPPPPLPLQSLARIIAHATLALRRQHAAACSLLSFLPCVHAGEHFRSRTYYIPLLCVRLALASFQSLCVYFYQLHSWPMKYRSSCRSPRILDSTEVTVAVTRTQALAALWEPATPQAVKAQAIEGNRLRSCVYSSE